MMSLGTKITVHGTAASHIAIKKMAIIKFAENPDYEGTKAGDCAPKHV